MKQWVKVILVIIMILSITGCTSETDDFYTVQPTEAEKLDRLIEAIADGNQEYVVNHMDETVVLWLKDNAEKDIANSLSDWEDIQYNMIRVIFNGLVGKSSKEYTAPRFDHFDYKTLEDNQAITLGFNEGITSLMMTPAFDSETIDQIEGNTLVTITEKPFLVEDQDGDDVWDSYYVKIQTETGSEGYVYADEIYQAEDFTISFEFKNDDWIITKLVYGE